MYQLFKLEDGERTMLLEGNGPHMRLALVDLFTRLMGVAHYWRAAPDGKFASILVDWHGGGHSMVRYFVEAVPE